MKEGMQHLYHEQSKKLMQQCKDTRVLKQLVLWMACQQGLAPYNLMLAGPD